MNNLSVFACESQPIVLEGLDRVLASSGRLFLAGSSPSLAAALEKVADLRPDLILLEPSRGLNLAFQFISEVKKSSPNTQPILWVTDLEETDCFRALQMGARGIVRKTMPVESLLDCCDAVAAGNIWFENPPAAVAGENKGRPRPRLTPRERDIVKLVCNGRKNKEIGAALSITAGTVKVHMMHIFEKSGAKDRFELAIRGQELLALEEAPPAEVRASGN